MKKQEASGRRRRIAAAAIAVALLGGILLGSYLLKTAGAKREAEDTPSSPETKGKQVTVKRSEEKGEQEEDQKGSETFAIFGVDSRENELGEGTRSDSIMLVQVDHEKKKIRVASVYRDCLVWIEGHGFEKITHAHAYGGPELAVDTVNRNFDLQVSQYLTVNFQGVAEAVDAVGGVEQTLDEEEADVINSYIKEVNTIRKTSSGKIEKAGTYVLDGTQAVAFSRIRYTEGGDYKRTERQRAVLFQLFEKAKSLSADKKRQLLERLGKGVRTNFSAEDLLKRMKQLSEYQVEEMNAFPQVFYGGIIEGAWVEAPVTLTEMNAKLHLFLQKEENYLPSSQAQKYSDEIAVKAGGQANVDLSDQ